MKFNAVKLIFFWLLFIKVKMEVHDLLQNTLSRIYSIKANVFIIGSGSGDEKSYILDLTDGNDLKIQVK